MLNPLRLYRSFNSDLWLRAFVAWSHCVSMPPMKYNADIVFATRDQVYEESVAISYSEIREGFFGNSEHEDIWYIYIYHISCIYIYTYIYIYIRIYIRIYMYIYIYIYIYIKCGMTSSRDLTLFLPFLSRPLTGHVSACHLRHVYGARDIITALRKRRAISRYLYRVRVRCERPKKFSGCEPRSI